MNKTISMRPNLVIVLIGITALVVFSLGTIHVQAQEPTPTPDNGTCIKCHEDLYFLHDTGNWFCIRESPMSCVDCHGGDPTSLQKDEAHFDRKAHPIINDDISKCQECHPAECDERVAKFDQVAGISKVLVAVPYQPTIVSSTDQIPDTSTGKTSDFFQWASAMEIITPVFLAGLVLVIYLFNRKHKSKKES